MCARRLLLPLCAATIIAVGLFGLALPASAQGVVFHPAACDLELNPGDSQTVQVTVCIPGHTSYKQMDLYFLADNTGSMGSIITDVKLEVVDLVADIVSSVAHPDMRIGVGAYRDFPNNEYAFKHILSPAPGITPAQQAILFFWMANAGFDGSEAQLFALNQIATSPEIGFRENAKRIVFWFGDAPGHDPICAEISGEPADVTEVSVTQDLVQSGPGGAAVLATSLSSGAFESGLDADPSTATGDYEGICLIGGDPGQGSRIAVNTGGAFSHEIDATQTAETVLATFVQFLREVDVSLRPRGEIAPFIESIVPESLVVTLPDVPSEEVCVSFLVTFSADSCVENQSLFEGEIEVHFDGAVAEGDVKPVTITQPGCDTICLLLLGLDPVEQPLDLGVPGAQDWLYVVPIMMLPLTLDDIPVIPIPPNPVLQGLHVYTQVHLLNDVDFPTDPLKMSNGLDFELGGPVVSYGTPSGMQHWALGHAAPGGAIDTKFMIEGFGP